MWGVMAGEESRIDLESAVALVNQYGGILGMAGY